MTSKVFKAKKIQHYAVLFRYDVGFVELNISNNGECSWKIKSRCKYIIYLEGKTLWKEANLPIKYFFLWISY